MRAFELCACCALTRTRPADDDAEGLDHEGVRRSPPRVPPFVNRLLLANLVLALLLAGHVADHALRQPAGEQLSLLASLPGLLGTVAVFVSLALVARGRRRARELAGVVGLLTAAGFAAVHLAPHWSMFSDPYADRYLDAGSWIEMLAGLAGGLWLAWEASRPALRRRRSA